MVRKARAACLSLSLLVFAGLLTMTAACGPTLPPRYVVERDVGPWSYRRFQQLMDVEFRVADNEAEAYSAVYLRRQPDEDAPGQARVNAMVSVYTQAASLASEIRDRVERLGTYETSIVRISGENVWRLDGDESPWLLWVSGQHVVKLGWLETDEPEDIIDLYLDRYPSDLDEHGRAEEGSASAGPSQSQAEDSAEDELDLPASLREDAPL